MARQNSILHQRHAISTGIMLMLGFTIFMPVCDSIAKYISRDYPVIQVVWGRYLFHFIVMLPLLWWHYHHSAAVRWLPEKPWLQLLRGSTLVGSTLLFFAAIAAMPLADALALMYIFPMVVTALSPWLLKEHVGIHRWSAVVIGFTGICIMLRPGSQAFQLSALLALASGLVLGLYCIVTRRLSGNAPALMTLAYTALVGAVVMTCIVPFYWLPPTPAVWLLMLIMGAAAAFGHTLMILAFDYAEASLLAPLAYAEMIIAVLIGYLIFGDFPDIWVWSGIVIVIASGMYISLRETHRSD
jgi:drug/metabolite transporter (DMT)-like permease